MRHDGSAPRDDRAHWDAKHRERRRTSDVPSPWVIDRCLVLPPTATIVDVAGGAGRHARALTDYGKRVVLMDFVEHAVRDAIAGTRVIGLVADVAELPLRAESVDAIVCVNFLDRSAFQAFATALAPGGVLVYETFTAAHLDVVARGRAHGPRNPDYLLASDELPRLVAPLVVEEHEEALVVDAAGERHVARVMAFKR